MDLNLQCYDLSGKAVLLLQTFQHVNAATIDVCSLAAGTDLFELVTRMVD